MALMAHLQFGDNISGLYSKDYLVADCHLHFTRHHNHFRPDTDTRCEKVEVVVVAPGKEDLSLYEWYIGREVLSGRIVFDLDSLAGGSNEDTRFLEFEDAYCFSISEEYQINALQRRNIRLSFVAEAITVNGVAFNNLFSEKGK